MWAHRGSHPGRGGVGRRVTAGTHEGPSSGPVPKRGGEGVLFGFRGVPLITWQLSLWIMTWGSLCVERMASVFGTRRIPEVGGVGVPPFYVSNSLCGKRGNRCVQCSGRRMDVCLCGSGLSACFPSFPDGCRGLRTPPPLRGLYFPISFA